MEEEIVSVIVIDQRHLDIKERFLIKYDPKYYPCLNDLMGKIREGLEEYIKEKQVAIRVDSVISDIEDQHPFHTVVSCFLRSEKCPTGIKRIATIRINLYPTY